MRKQYDYDRIYNLTDKGNYGVFAPCMDAQAALNELANYFLNRLPEDFICHWDLMLTEKDTKRDSSAAAVAAIGMSEMLKYIPISDESRIIYENACLHITKSLCDNYLGTNNEGILKHGVYHFKGGLGIDEYLIFGDYFFVELLTRLYKDWDSYW